MVDVFIIGLLGVIAVGVAMIEYRLARIEKALTTKP